MSTSCDSNSGQETLSLDRRNILLSGASLLTLAATAPSLANAQDAKPEAATTPKGGGDKPNILVIFGDDIGQSNVSAYTFGLMGYRTPNIDRLAREGMMFTDYYAEQSCTAGRSSFITGQTTLRTGLSKVVFLAPISVCARRYHHCRSLEAAWLRNRAVRQEPPWGQERVSANASRFR